MNAYRSEHDLLSNRQVPAEAYYVWIGVGSERRSAC
jgi:aspartate ammonia-lyase